MPMPDKSTPTINPAMLLVMFDEPVIAQRWAIEETGSITAAVMISYALQINTQSGWFAKTYKEWNLVTGLTRSEIETAKNKLVEKGLLHTRKVGMPARLEYRVDHDSIEMAIKRLADKYAVLNSPSAEEMQPRGKVKSCAFPPTRLEFN